MGGVDIHEEELTKTDPRTWKRYTAEIWGRPHERLNIIFEDENSEVSAHISVSVYNVAGPAAHWSRLPTDSELAWVARKLFGDKPWEEDNPKGVSLRARHIWLKS